MHEVQLIVCPQCEEAIMMAKSKEEGDIKSIKITCDCGHEFSKTFIGDPAVGFADGYYFEILGENEYKCIKTK